ncbi:hypothetical protein EON79_21125 [bacterium]|nr:MAG: hypothetical protein EON79_21125 [bacterium]
MLIFPYAFVGSDTRVHVEGMSGASQFKSAREPDLSRDGRSLVYWADDGNGPGRLQLRNLSTGTERTLRRGNLRSPRISPDGKTVCFTEFRDNVWTLCAVAIGGGPVRVLQKGGDVFMPVWQDEGSLYAQVGGKFVAMDFRGTIVRPYPIEVTGSDQTAIEGPDGTLYFTKDVPSDLPKAANPQGFPIAAVFRYTPTEGVSRVSPPKTSMRAIRIWNGRLIGEGTDGKRDGIFSLAFDGTAFKFLRAGTEPGT